MTRADCRIPSGGTKNSGFGRDCLHEGAREFCNIKTIFINWFSDIYKIWHY